MMKAKHFLNVLGFAATIAAVLAFGDIDIEDGVPEKKLISTFQIVRFPNDACTGSGTRNGTCFTSAECSDKGGASSGSCADGFGVCCIFVINTCGSMSSENITYWDNPADTFSTSVPSTCTLTVCPANDNICQLRVDFTSFVITGPSTSTFSENHHQYGTIPTAGLAATTAGAGAAGTVGNWATNCLLDDFSVNGVSPSNAPPVLCGTNDGTHMYVDANVENCNTFAFNFSPMPGPAPDGALTADSRGLGALASRKWDMTIYQYECGYTNAAPPGCTQYLWGPVTGTVSSYNFGATSKHLANQNQKICIRKERGRCYACFAHDGTAANFQVSGSNGANLVRTYPGTACGYGCELDNGLGAAGDACGGYDCIIIPGAFAVGVTSSGIITGTTANIQTLVAATYQVPAPPQIGGAGALSVGNAAVNAIIPASAVVTQHTLCTKHVPFQLTFKSDHFEGTGAGGEHLDATAPAQTGFLLNYSLVNCVA